MRTKTTSLPVVALVIVCFVATATASTEIEGSVDNGQNWMDFTPGADDHFDVDAGDLSYDAATGYYEWEPTGENVKYRIHEEDLTDDEILALNSYIVPPGDCRICYKGNGDFDKVESR